MTRPALLLLASLALAAPSLAAQPLRVSAGVRARVAAPPRPGWVVGTVVVADSARIVLQRAPGAAPDTVPLAAVRALDVSAGRPRLGRTIRGILFGILIGGAVGAAVDAGADVGASQDTRPGLLGGVIGAVSGALIGGAVGAATAPERWRYVPVP